MRGWDGYECDGQMKLQDMFPELKPQNAYKAPVKDFMNKPITDEDIREISGLSKEDYEVAKEMCELMCGGVEDEMVADSTQDCN